MHLPVSVSSRTALLGAVLCLGTPCVVHADFTENLIARWTFNQPGAQALVDDVKSLKLDAGTLPSAAGRDAPRPVDGVVKLELGHYLTAPGLSDKAAPMLKTGVTLWACLRLEGGDVDRTGFIMGLMQQAKPGDWEDAALVLMHRPPGLGKAVGFSAYGNVQPNGDFGFGENCLPDTVGKFQTVAVIFDGRAGSISLVVDGVVKTVRKAEADKLQPAAALMLGQLKAAGGAAVTFDEVRVYRGAIAPDWLGDITPVPNPVNTAR